jgi:tetratricopeptide (TPR) repeat protein
LRHEPRHADALRNSAVAYRNLGRIDDAKRVYAAAMAYHPRDAVLLTNYCNLASDLGDYEAVHGAAGTAVEVAPDNANAWYMLGLAGDRLGRGDGGLAAMQRAVSLMPDRADYKAALAVILQKSGDFESSERYALEVLRGDANNSDAWVVLAQCHFKRRAFAEGLEAYARAEALKPDNAAIWINRAVALRELGRTEEAVRNSRRGIELAPENPEGHFNLSLLLLTLGQFDEGWKEYRWRMDPRRKPSERVELPSLKKPMWQGEPLDGKTLLLMPEQGFGDWIQFVRYAALIRERGGSAAAAVHNPLYRLFKTMPALAKVYRDGEAIEHYDYWALPLSLPQFLGTETGYGVQRYLHAPPELVGPWAARIGGCARTEPSGKPLIGLVWEGRGVHPRDAARSVAIAKLATLLLDERYDWVALQHGDKYAQGYQVGPRLIHNLGKQVADFADTAAILSQLDLLISIDSAPVHLAGALGVPCWVMLDAAPDWRWGLQGETTPWYPSLRLFRQEKAGDWGVVVGRLARELETFTSQGMHVG